MSLPAPYAEWDCGVLYCGDCQKILPFLGSIDAVVADPPYGMGKAEWDEEIPDWLPLISEVPCAIFCGVIGMRDYPPADWTGAWVRQGSTQRNGKLRGFNNWEPILFYRINSLLNDVISEPNYHEDFGHPTTKPLPLIERLIRLMPEGTVLDPFIGSGTTAVACIRTGRRFIGIELNPEYCAITKSRIDDELMCGRYKSKRPVSLPGQKSIFEE